MKKADTVISPACSGPVSPSLAPTALTGSLASTPASETLPACRRSASPSAAAHAASAHLAGAGLDLFGGKFIEPVFLKRLNRLPDGTAGTIVRLYLQTV